MTEGVLFSVAPVDHKYVMVPVPPLAVAETLPFDPFKQLTAVGVTPTDNIAAGSVKAAALKIEVHKLASVIVTV